MVKLFYVGIQGYFEDIEFNVKIVKVNTELWKEYGLYPQPPDAVKVTDRKPFPGFD